ncbi:tetratricopeptide repeat protein [Cystobacter fuscus]|uniref:tetratricopeptide repeat protein n=1 Tax=Cystobacter fuscus TaxID=43 RepID=UPI0037C09A7B
MHDRYGVMGAETNTPVYCDEETVSHEVSWRKGATRFVIADFRPRSERAEDTELGRRAANVVDRLLRDYMGRVSLPEAGEFEQARVAREMDVRRLGCVIRDETAALTVGRATGADLLLWGDAVCPLVSGTGTPLINIVLEANDNARILTERIVAEVKLPKDEPGSFCARASLTAWGWPAMGSNSDEFRSASVLDSGGLELPQVVAGDALGLTLFVAGLHFYVREDYARALPLFQSASKQLLTDSRSAAELFLAMGLTEHRAGRFDRVPDYLGRCEHLAKRESAVWWHCRMSLVDALGFASEPTKAKELAKETVHLARTTGFQRAEANMLGGLGYLAHTTSEFEDAKKYYEDSLHLYTVLGDRLGLALTLMGLGDLARDMSAFKEAKARYGEALLLFRAVGQTSGVAHILHGLGELALLAGDFEEAKRKYDEALSLFRTLDYRRGEAAVLRSLGNLALDMEDLMEARPRLEEALALYQAISDKQGQGSALQFLGIVALRRSELKEARERLDASLSLFLITRDRQGEAITRVYLGGVALRAGMLSEARARFDEALFLFRAIGDRRGEAFVLSAFRKLADVANRHDKAEK